MLSLGHLSMLHVLQQGRINNYEVAGVYRLWQMQNKHTDYSVLNYCSSPHYSQVQDMCVHVKVVFNHDPNHGRWLKQNHFENQHSSKNQPPKYLSPLLYSFSGFVLAIIQGPLGSWFVLWVRQDCDSVLCHSRCLLLDLWDTQFSLKSQNPFWEATCAPGQNSKEQGCFEAWRSADSPPANWYGCVGPV